MSPIARSADLPSRGAWLWRNRLRFGDSTPSEIPRLLVDVSAIIGHDAQTGIQRVVRAVWSELRQRSGSSFNVVPVFARRTHGYCYAPFDFLGGDALSQSGEPASVRPGDKFLALDLAAHLLPKYRAQLRAWRSHGATLHAIVYDLLPLQHPEWFNRAMVRHFGNWLSVLRDDVDQAICISDDVAENLREHVRKAGGGRLNVGRMRLGADIAASLPSRGSTAEVARVLERMRERPAILMVGTVEPRKGHDAALSAFEELWRADPANAPDLVVVGKPGWKTEALQETLSSHLEHGRRLHWLRRVSDDELSRLYETSAGVFMASRAEGFGLPLAEAAFAKRFVLVRDLPVFREQQLANVLYFDDDAPAPLARRIMDLLEAGKQGPAPLTKLSSWSECVEELLREIGLGVDQVIEPSPALRKAS